MEETQYATFEELWNAVKGVTYQEAMALGFEEMVKAKLPGMTFDDFNDYAALTACGDTMDIVKEIAATFNLGIMTYIVSDEGFTLTTGMHWVNREYFLFCWDSEAEGFCDEADDCEYDDDGNIISDYDEEEQE